MTIFSVIVTGEARPGALKERLTKQFADDHIAITSNAWLVAGKGPSQLMSNKLGISDGSVANGVVAAMSSYYGRAPSNIWDWVKAKWEEKAESE